MGPRPNTDYYCIIRFLGSPVFCIVASNGHSMYYFILIQIVSALHAFPLCATTVTAFSIVLSMYVMLRSSLKEEGTYDRCMRVISRPAAADVELDVAANKEETPVG